jgi:cyclopropane-fatty-acyl-phospholipid synthase
MAVLSIVTTALDALRGYAGSVGWGPLVRISRTAILSLLSRIEKGSLVVKESDGRETVCGSRHSAGGPGPRTELMVHREAFWVRLLLFADMVRVTGALFVAVDTN